VLFPIKINVLKGVDIPGGSISEIMAAANDALYPAQIYLTWVTNWDVEVGNGDNRIDDDEYRELTVPARCELNSLYHGHGKKIYLAQFLWDPGCPGSSTKKPIDYQPVCNPIFIGIGWLPNAKRIGKILGHEIGHALGGLEDIPGVTDDLMSQLPENLLESGGTKLSKEDGDKIREGAKQAGGYVIKIGGRLIHLDTKHAGWADSLTDVTGDEINLNVGSLFAEGSTADLEVSIGLSGLYPNGTDVNSTFQMGFNTDNNNSTGYYGVDKILRITLQGKYPFAQPNGSISADLYDVDSGVSDPLAAGVVERIYRVEDGINASWEFEYFDSIQQSLPLSLLDPLADVVPIDLWATNLDTGEYDYTSFQFDFNPPPGATIEMEPLEAVPGQNVNVNGTRFPPVSTIKLLIDDTEILQTTTLGDGTFSVSFTVPNLAPGWYFVIAMSETRGNQIINSLYFDFSILTVPSPNLEIDITGGLGVNAIITNNGTANASGVEWQIHVEGGILGLINKTINGTIDVAAGESKTVGTGLFFGLGPIAITAKVADEEKTATGIQFIIFSMVK